MGKKYQKASLASSITSRNEKSSTERFKRQAISVFNTNGSQSTVSVCIVSADVTIGVDTTAAAGATDA